MAQVTDLKLDRTEQVESCIDFLQKEINNIQDSTLQSMAQSILDDDKFLKARGARNKHHNFEGGLVVHTSEVVEIALNIAESQSLEVDKDILLTGIMYHDYGKIYEYTQDEAGEWQYTSHLKNIGHLPRSFGKWMIDSEYKMIDEETIQKVGHIILAHHGRLEWRSPVEPNTTEAHIIHYADMLSAFCSKDFYVRN